MPSMPCNAETSRGQKKSTSSPAKLTRLAEPCPNAVPKCSESPATLKNYIDRPTTSRKSQK
jgi:hypothetical protein